MITKVYFPSSKPYIFKKTIVTILILIAFVYCILKLHWFVSLMYFLIVCLPKIIKISKQESGNGGFFNKVKTYYKDMYKNSVVDYLPLFINIDKEKISIKIKSAEYFSGETVNETFTFKPENIAGILYDDISNDIMFLLSEVSVLLKFKHSKKEKIIQKKKTAISFKPENIKELVSELEDKNYIVERLSEIEDEEEETEDPELVKQEK